MRRGNWCRWGFGMIERAKKIDPNGNYIYHDLMAWEPSTPVDIIHSMEVIYYFNDPKK